FLDVLIYTLPLSLPFPYTTLFRSPSPRNSTPASAIPVAATWSGWSRPGRSGPISGNGISWPASGLRTRRGGCLLLLNAGPSRGRSEEHTSELQSHLNLVCRLLLEK